MIIHTVVPGDSIYRIARMYNVPASRIITDNMLTDPGRLIVGETLAILFPTETYTVRGGDTLSSIASRFNVPLLQLYQNNPALGGEAAVYPGQTLNIRYTPPENSPICVNGYAYPYIDRSVLCRTLPYLTYLSLFSYGIAEDGSLISPQEKEMEILTLCRKYQTTALLTLTSLSESGTFSSALANRVLTDPALQEKVVESVADAVVQMGYGGVDVDFEYIPRESAAAYAGFVGAIRKRLEPDHKVFVSAAPKVSADQSGLLYGGHDYRLLGKTADMVLLMTYEWGYTYGPPMAVSPLPQVKRVLDYGATEIPRDKILMGVPNYGYDWPLPYERGRTKAESLSNVEAIQRAAVRNAVIRYDDTAQAPYYTYFDRPTQANGAVEHEVWFENGRSAEAMLSLVAEYSLGGIGVWNVMQYFPALWLVLNQMYPIVKNG